MIHLKIIKQYALGYYLDIDSNTIRAINDYYYKLNNRNFLIIALCEKNKPWFKDINPILPGYKLIKSDYGHIYENFDIYERIV